MTPGTVSKRIVLERLAWVENMLAEIRALPLVDQQSFFADSRNSLAAESYLRRALEALFDLGRHILAKGFGEGAVEYRGIAAKLMEKGVLVIYKNDLGDMEQVAGAFKGWMEANPQRMDETL